MDFKIKNKVAIVTGASEGIGKAIAMGLAIEGAKVGISARREKELNSAAEEIVTQTNGEIIAFAGDMSVKADVELFIDKVISRWETVHILVNNVGCAKKALFKELSQEDWHAALNTNLYSAIFCTELVLSYMQKHRWGRIINIAAVSGREPRAGHMASNVTKSGLISFSKNLATEVAADGILVNCVCPGSILSPQISRLLTPEEQESASTQIPVGRFGTQEELANLVVFLASECNSYITGTTISVDGGITKGLY